MDRVEIENLTRLWISLWTAPFNPALFDRLHGDDFVDGSPAGRQTSKTAYRRSLEDFIEAFPDVVSKVEDLVIDEHTGKAAVHWSTLGTNRKCYLGVGPTHRQTRITGIEIIEFKEGRVIQRWGEWDIMEHLSRRQTGFAPAGREG